MATAHIIATFYVNADGTPEFSRWGVYSERNLTSVRGELYLEYFVAHGASYHEAAQVAYECVVAMRNTGRFPRSFVDECEAYLDKNTKRKSVTVAVRTPGKKP